ncbi:MULTISPECIES: hypothetical protein [Microcystis]|jgi:hypothetical protein|uniref:Restriction endonuclease subunit S n=4 Tax=Microcystis TaxID=1125 RepID=S3J661_MICAE|nr:MULTISPECIES: hypothetical protein [Microcystis]MBD2290944.1 restriction endonuclease subunit S [Microcystis wesenbergii FACHB-1317]MCZ8128999.1 restriction endonuclease subunit S [Microcystis sp. LE19-114.1B]NCQ91379.1 restriction endonuclease subunit S [Microcystis aeruginosa LG13-13]NCR04538.1 restriction endonuclease subunit S [Microcystis aeruginosa LG13-03]NCR54666.1 restriction endonuclease subunit S [Microcystis aeruginosa L211-07]NCR62829.1 restriction endonuclease subunit S [Micr
MSIPPKIQILINQLDRQLNEIEQQAAQGINLLRSLLSYFPENVILMQYFAYLNTILFFLETARRQIQTTIDTISDEDVPRELIQEAGEDLGMLQGKIIEEKIRLQRLIDFLGNNP